jgi:hypothetical protein
VYGPLVTSIDGPAGRLRALATGACVRMAHNQHDARARPPRRDGRRWHGR